MRSALFRIHGGLAWGSVAAVVAQFFFAGLGIFGASSFAAHQLTGVLIVGAALVLLLLALAGRMGAMRIGLAAGLLVLTVVQPLLVHGPSLLAALHPVNALAILFITLALARQGSMSSRWAPRARPTMEGVA
jgi:hypothetical protein